MSLGYEACYAALKVTQLTVIWSRLTADWKLLLLIDVRGAVGHELVFVIIRVTVGMFLESIEDKNISRAQMRIDGKFSCCGLN